MKKLMAGFKTGLKCRGCLLAVAIVFTAFCMLFSVFVFAAEKWPGVDEAVVEKIAKEHGREASEPFINTDRGDLLLFVFLVTGAVGGFVAGYYWRVLTERRPQGGQPENMGQDKGARG